MFPYFYWLRPSNISHLFIILLLHLLLLLLIIVFFLANILYFLFTTFIIRIILLNLLLFLLHFEVFIHFLSWLLILILLLLLLLLMVLRSSLTNWSRICSLLVWKLRIKKHQSFIHHLQGTSHLFVVIHEFVQNILCTLFRKFDEERLGWFDIVGCNK